MQNLAPLLAVLIAGGLLWLAKRSNVGPSVGAPGPSPLVRLSPTRGGEDRGGEDRAARWGALRLIFVGALLGLGAVIALPWIAASGSPSCVTARAGEACVDGEPVSPLPWLFVASAALPLILLVAGDLRRLR